MKKTKYIKRIDPEILKVEINHESIEEATQEFLKKKNIKLLKPDATTYDSSMHFPSCLPY